MCIENEEECELYTVTVQTVDLDLNLVQKGLRDDEYFSVKWRAVRGDEDGISKLDQLPGTKVDLEKFQEIDNLLYQSEKDSRHQTRVRLCIPAALVNHMMFLMNDSPLAGHPGQQRMLANCRRNFYFPKIARIISDYVLQCASC